MAAGLAGLAGLVSASAEAGAWTRPKGEGLFILGYSLHRLEPGSDQGGRVSLKYEASVYGEFGLSDQLTLVGRAAWQTVADGNVVGVAQSEIASAPSEPASLSQSGVGGIELGARYRLFESGRWVGSVQAVVNVPSSGENQNNDRFGEGVGGLDLRTQLGRSVGQSGFFSLSSGWRTHEGPRPDELRLDLTAGIDVIDGITAMAQTYSVWSLSDQTITNYSYAGHRAQLSILVRLSDSQHGQLSVLSTFAHDNMSEERALMASIWRRF